MKKSEVRPSTTYIGAGGELRLAQEVKMDVAGELYVVWKGVGKWRGGSGGMPVTEFAKWAKTIQDTASSDLKHHLTK